MAPLLVLGCVFGTGSCFGVPEMGMGVASTFPLGSKLLTVKVSENISAIEDGDRVRELSVGCSVTVEVWESEVICFAGGRLLAFMAAVDVLCLLPVADEVPGLTCLGLILIGAVDVDGVEVDVDDVTVDVLFDALAA